MLPDVESLYSIAEVPSKVTVHQRAQQGMACWDGGHAALQGRNFAALDSFDVQSDGLRSIWALDSRQTRLESRQRPPLGDGLARFLQEKGLGQDFSRLIPSAKL